MNENNLKARIVKYASALLGQQGVRKVTMNDIATGLGISKRTLYAHFENKDELMAACVDLHHAEMMAKGEEIGRQAKNPIDFMHRHFRLAVEVIRNTNPDFLEEFKRFHPEVYREKYEPQQKRMHAHTIEMIREGVVQGLFRTDIDPNILTRLLYAQLELMHDKDLFPPERFTRVDLFQHIVLGFLRTLVTEKGAREMEQLFTVNAQEYV